MRLLVLLSLFLLILLLLLRATDNGLDVTHRLVCGHIDNIALLFWSRLG